jgi:hypothetical protein
MGFSRRLMDRCVLVKGVVLFLQRCEQAKLDSLDTELFRFLLISCVLGTDLFCLVGSFVAI